MPAGGLRVMKLEEELDRKPFALGTMLRSVLGCCPLARRSSPRGGRCTPASSAPVCDRAGALVAAFPHVPIQERQQ